MWFYQYQIKVVVEDIERIDHHRYKEVIRNGLIPASTYMEAMQGLVNYYGDDNIVNIMQLTAALEGDVFEFEDANENLDFNYKVIKKGD